MKSPHHLSPKTVFVQQRNHNSYSPGVEGGGVELVPELNKIATASLRDSFAYAEDAARDSAGFRVLKGLPQCAVLRRPGSAHPSGASLRQCGADSSSPSWLVVGDAAYGVWRRVRSRQFGFSATAAGGRRKAGGVRAVGVDPLPEGCRRSLARESPAQRPPGRQECSPTATAWLFQI